MWLWGPFHRNVNDVDRSAIASGAYTAVLCSGFVGNSLHGPFNEKCWFEDVQELGEYVAANCDADNPVLLKLWPKICQDKKWSSPDDTGKIARARYVKTITKSKTCTTLPRKLVAKNGWGT